MVFEEVSLSQVERFPSSYKSQHGSIGSNTMQSRIYFQSNGASFNMEPSLHSHCFIVTVGQHNFVTLILPSHSAGNQVSLSPSILSHQMPRELPNALDPSSFRVTVQQQQIPTKLGKKPTTGQNSYPKASKTRQKTAMPLATSTIQLSSHSNDHRNPSRKRKPPLISSSRDTTTAVKSNNFHKRKHFERGANRALGGRDYQSPYHTENQKIAQTSSRTVTRGASIKLEESNHSKPTSRTTSLKRILPTTTRRGNSIKSSHSSSSSSNQAASLRFRDSTVSAWTNSNSHSSLLHNSDTDLEGGTLKRNGSITVPSLIQPNIGSSSSLLSQQSQPDSKQSQLSWKPKLAHKKQSSFRNQNTSNNDELNTTHRKQRRRKRKLYSAPSSGQNLKRKSPHQADSSHESIPIENDAASRRTVVVSPMLVVEQRSSSHAPDGLSELSSEDFDSRISSPLSTNDERNFSASQQNQRLLKRSNSFTNRHRHIAEKRQPDDNSSEFNSEDSQQKEFLTQPLAQSLHSSVNNVFPNKPSTAPSISSSMQMVSKLGQLSRMKRKKKKSFWSSSDLHTSPSDASLVGISHSTKGIAPLMHKDMAMKRLGHVVKQIPQEMEKENEKLRREQRMYDKEKYKVLFQKIVPKKANQSLPDQSSEQKYHPLTRSSKYHKKMTGYDRVKNDSSTRKILEPYTQERNSRSPDLHTSVRSLSPPPPPSSSNAAPSKRKHKQKRKKRATKDPDDEQYEKVQQETAALVQSVQNALEDIDTNSNGLPPMQPNDKKRSFANHIGPRAVTAPTTTPSRGNLSKRSKNDFTNWNNDSSESMSTSSTGNSVDNQQMLQNGEVSLRHVNTLHNQLPQQQEENRPVHLAHLQDAAEISPSNRRAVASSERFNFMKPTKAMLLANGMDRPHTTNFGERGMDTAETSGDGPRKRSSLHSPLGDDLYRRRKGRRTLGIKTAQEPSPKRRVLDFTNTPFPKHHNDDLTIEAPLHEADHIDSPPTPKYLKESQFFHADEIQRLKREAEERKRTKEYIRKEKEEKKAKIRQKIASGEIDFIPENMGSTIRDRLPEKLRRRLLFEEEEKGR